MLIKQIWEILIAEGGCSYGVVLILDVLSRKKCLVPNNGKRTKEGAKLK